MTPVFEFTLDATSGVARTGALTLPHGTVETPVFMPVGTQGTVRALSPNDLRNAGATLVLANSYHLHGRPGEQVVEKLGALHRFMGWDRPLLTDSGGFQVFSLEGSRRLDEDGVEFQSHVDGGRRTLTPERATEIQWTLGADIAMAFDHVVPGGADEATARDAMERTLRWLERCRKRHGELVPRSVGASCNQTLWPILQGGTHLELRTEGPAAFSSSAPGPAWPSVAFPSGSPRRSCTTCWSGSSRSSPPSRVILWAWDSRRIWWRRWSAESTCSNASRRRATAGDR